MARLLRSRLGTGELELPVEGASMGSTIDAGSTVEVVGAPRARPGEIWAFVAAEGTILVHRIRHVDDEVFTGRGVGNRRDDAPLPSNWLIGRVIASTSPSGRRRQFKRVDRLLANLHLKTRQVLRALRRFGGRR